MIKNSKSNFDDLSDQLYIIESDDSVAFTLLGENSRLAIIINDNPKESSWHFVTKTETGGPNEYGTLRNLSAKTLKKWLAEYRVYNKVK